MATKTYRPAGLPSFQTPDGDRVFLKQELDKLAQVINGVNGSISGINTTLTLPANTMLGNNTGAPSVALPLTVPQIQALLGIGLGRIPLLAPTTFYVSTSGSDTTGLGTSLSPWRTWQFAYNTVANTYDFRGFQVTLTSTGAFTYTVGLAIGSGWTGGGSLVLDGNGSTIASASGPAISTNGPPLAGLITLQNFTLTSVGGSAILHTVPGTFNVRAGMVYGTCTVAHFQLFNTGPQVQLFNNYTITGGALFHLAVAFTGSALRSNAALTITHANPVTFSSGYALTDLQGLLYFPGNTFVNPGNVTGPRFSCNNNSLMYVAGAGLAYFPGTVAGTQTNNGQYF